jgi:hypothetical protein
MYSEENAIITMLQSQFINRIYENILVNTYEDYIYPNLIETLTVKEQTLFNASYTKDGDFYEIDADVTAENIAAIKIILARIFYDIFILGYPMQEDISKSILASIFFNTWSDNFENDRVEAQITVDVYAATGFYLEGSYVSRIIKSIELFGDTETSARTFKGWEFIEVSSRGAFSRLPETYLVTIHGKEYYPFRFTFDLVYREI